MKQNNSGNVVCADDPRNMMIGWIDLNTDKWWQINIERFRQSSFLMGEESAKMIRDNISGLASVENRVKILEFLNELPLERLCNLKAFW